MSKKISILGSTGSIGVQTLQVVDEHPEDFEILYLSTNRSIEKLYEQVQKYKPKAVVICDYEKYREFRDYSLPNLRVLYGAEGLCEIASDKQNDLIVSAIVGFSGLKPTIVALESGIDVALANKETIVVSGSIIKDIINRNNAKLISVDSEHNAILQCLVGEDINSVEKVILTASGGPFFEMDTNLFNKVTVEEALAHPRWNMGRKITIDSATLMNKGLEVIEAHWLFDFPSDKIQVLIHPESIIHSMVQFIDGSIKAQLGVPDMRIPISFALNYPKRKEYSFPRVNFVEISKLTFLEPDFEKFPCLKLAYRALESNGTAPTVLNAANEVAVNAFLDNVIRFDQIPICVEFALNKIENIPNPTLEDVFQIDEYTRKITNQFIMNNLK